MCVARSFTTPSAGALLDLLRHARALALRLDALGAQLRAVVGGELRHAPFRLLDGGARAFDAVLLRPQVLLGLEALAAALAPHQLAGKALVREALEGALLLDQHRKRAGELALRLLRGAHLAPRARDHRALLGHCVFVGAHPRIALRLDLRIEIGPVLAELHEPLALQLGVDASQLQLAQCELGFERGRVGLGDAHVHSSQHLPRPHALAFRDQDFAQHAAFGRLHDPELRARHQASLGDGNDIEPAQADPGRERGEQRQHGPEHQPRQRRRGVLAKHADRLQELSRRGGRSIARQDWQCHGALLEGRTGSRTAAASRHRRKASRATGAR